MFSAWFCLMLPHALWFSKQNNKNQQYNVSTVVVSLEHWNKTCLMSLCLFPFVFKQGLMSTRLASNILSSQFSTVEHNATLGSSGAEVTGTPAEASTSWATS